MSIKLDRKDVIAIANDRIFRMVKWKIYIGMVVSALAILGGVLVYDVSKVGGVILLLVGIFILYLGLFIVDRRQKRERKALLKEWGEE